MNIQNCQYRNIGSYHISEDYNADYHSWSDQYAILNIELKNGALDNCTDIMRKFPNQFNKNFLTLEYLADGDIYTKEPTDDELLYGDCYEEPELIYSENLYVNNNELEMTDENLPVFEKLQKILCDITQLKIPEFIINSDFLESIDCFQMMERAVIFNKPKQVDKFIKSLHNPQDAKNIATFFSNTINNIVIKNLF